MKMKNVFRVNTILILLLLAACGALKPKLTLPTPTLTPEVLPATGTQYYFVSNKLLLPTTQAQSEAYALNVDGDAQEQLDNKFGNLLTLLMTAAPSLELQSTLDQTITSGQLVSLHVIKADDPLTDSTVSWSVFQGKSSQSVPAFDGTDKFTIDSAAPVNLPIVGSLVNGHFSGGPGTARVKLYLLGQSIDVDLLGVFIEADINPKGCINGKIGGGVTVEEFRDKILPTVADGLNQIIKINNAASTTLLQAFDSDHNGSITSLELQGNPVLMIAVSPDLDLLDTTGEFNPGQDGLKDSYSLGIGFTCVAATFVAPDN